MGLSSIFSSGKRRGGARAKRSSAKFLVPDGVVLSDRPCWCGTKEGRPLYHPNSQPSIFAAACPHCGTIRLSPHLSKEAAATYYSAAYHRERHDPGQFFESQLDRDSVGRVLPYLNSGMTVLDYGCGSGGKLCRLLAEGIRVFAFEPNEGYLVHALKNGLVLYDQNTKYDCIFLSHTVEHWAEPLSDLRSLIRQNLKNEGLIVVELPFLDRLLIGARRQGVRGDLKFSHAWYFSTSTLDKMMGQLGAERIYCDRMNTSIYRYNEKREVAAIKSTPVRDRLLRALIRVASIRPLPAFLGRLNRVIRYINYF
jgi:SAM-dependent methyltransferase